MLKDNTADTGIIQERKKMPPKRRKPKPKRKRKSYKKMYFDLLDKLLKQNKPKRRKKRR